MTRKVAARGRAGARQAMWAPAQPGTARVAMAELQQLRVQEAVDSMVKSLERENIRKMQVAGRKPTWGLGGASTVRGFCPFPQPPQDRFAPLPVSLQTRVGVSLGSSLRPWKHCSLLELELRLSE